MIPTPLHLHLELCFKCFPRIIQSWGLNMALSTRIFVVIAILFRYNVELASLLEKKRLAAKGKVSEKQKQENFGITWQLFSFQCKWGNRFVKGRFIYSWHRYLLQCLWWLIKVKQQQQNQQQQKPKQASKPKPASLLPGQLAHIPENQLIGGRHGNCHPHLPDDSHFV